jgi:hypothetical protein
MTIQQLADELSSVALLAALERDHGGADMLHHWQQGEFHHDIVLSVHRPGALPGPVLVVATNCNAGVKELLCFAEIPDRDALWHWRCPDNPEFAGTLQPILAQARTQHWFDPCGLLADDARSEYSEEFRERQRGGGWKLRE